VKWSAWILESYMAATGIREEERAEGGRDDFHRHYQRLSAIPPCIVFLPPSSSALPAEAKGPVPSQEEMVEAEAVQPAGARAGSDALGTERALQSWRPGRNDEGACGGVFSLRRWRLILGTLTIFLGVPHCC
jgi:hypothetical protein